MISRTLQTVILRALATFPSVLVTGPRQSGKTTLLKAACGKSHAYVSLENPDTRSRALSDPRAFLRDHPPPVIIDEIQYAPELLSYIQTAIDENRAPGMWLLTGSQNFPVMQGASQSLAGRVAIFTLFPLSIAEAMARPAGNSTVSDIISRTFEAPLDAPPPQFNLGDWLLRGAYPEVRSNPQVDRILWCASYVQTYLERDVRQMTNVGDLHTFERFLRLVAARTGQILNYSDLARDVGVSQPTAKQWMSILEASGQVHLLYPYFENFGKRLIKSPKLYFMDTAIAAFLMGLHTHESILHGPYAGPFFETAVVSNWVKVFQHRGEPPALYYWRSRDGLEVDLIIDRNGRLYPIEVKSTSTVTPHHATALIRWRELSRRKDAPLIIVADVDESQGIAPGVRAVPWWWG